MKERNLIGVDVGGTKCAITLGRSNGDSIEITDKEGFATTVVDETIENLKTAISKVLRRNGLPEKGGADAIGISCGGPLSSEKGIVMSPPNLPGWDNIPIVKILSDKFGAPAALQNDANACALAEWIFGAGLIIDGRLYSGTNDNAGELGHLRLSEYGPVGYGKAGSFEGFCSGGGIRQLGQMKVKEVLMMGGKVSWCPDGDVEKITAKDIAVAAGEGDPLAKEIYAISARMLGKGLSFVIDILNPEMIVIGSIYARNEGMMKPLMQEIIDSEALPLASKVCRVVPAALGESIGDYAALSVAANIKL